MLGSGRPWMVGTFTLMVVPALAATTIASVAMSLGRESTRDVTRGA
jgi:hypothetical protein